MKQQRGFEFVKDNKYADLNLPTRSSKTAVGYDFYAPEEITIKPKEKVFIKTNIKAYFQDDEAFIIAARSGITKTPLILANSIGLFESDYYNNEINDGNIIFCYWNMGDEAYTFKKGDRVGQGYFQKILRCEDVITTKRKGGFGSSGK